MEQVELHGGAVKQTAPERALLQAVGGFRLDIPAWRFYRPQFNAHGAMPAGLPPARGRL